MSLNIPSLTSPFVATLQPFSATQEIKNAQNENNQASQATESNSVTAQKENTVHKNALLTLFTHVPRGYPKVQAKDVTVEKVKSLIDGGADINARLASGMTPLRALYRLLYDHALDSKTVLDIAQILIDYGADVNATLNTESDDRSLLKTMIDCSVHIMSFSSSTKHTDREDGYFGFLKMLLNHPQIEFSKYDRCLITTLYRSNDRPEAKHKWEEVAKILIEKHFEIVSKERDERRYPPYQVMVGANPDFQPHFSGGDFDCIRSVPSYQW